MSAFKVRPNTRALVDPAKLAAFAGGAETTTAAPELDDKRRTPAFSLRLTAKELAILRHRAATTPDSMHEVCIKALREWLRDDLA